MSRPVAVICRGHPERRDPQRLAAGMAEHAADRPVGRRRGCTGRAGRSSPATAAARGRGRVEGHDRGRRSRRPSSRITVGRRRSPATTWALVTTRSSADHEPGAVLDPAAGDALDLHHRPGDRGRPWPRSSPLAAGGGPSVGRRARARRRPRGSRRRRPATAAPAWRRAARAGRRRSAGRPTSWWPARETQPGLADQHRQDQPDEHDEPDEAGDARPATRSVAPSTPVVAATGGAGRRSRARAPGPSDAADEQQPDRSGPAPGRGSAVSSRSRNGRQQPDRHDQPEAEPEPRHARGSTKPRRYPPMTASTASATKTTSNDVHRGTAVGIGSARRRAHSPSRRAWVRKPVWATMRWSGRTAWPSMCQVRFRTSMRLGHVEARWPRAPRGAAWPG